MALARHVRRALARNRRRAHRSWPLPRTRRSDFRPLASLHGSTRAEEKRSVTPTVHEAIPAAEGDELELSVVMPCLNESDTIAVCIKKALGALEQSGIAGEVVIADNGSTDGSQLIAERLGVRVVPVAERGYGSALMGGIAAARGKFVIMGDADDSYDFRDIPKFVEKLREGYD